jgi:hypothetical protein
MKTLRLPILKNKTSINITINGDSVKFENHNGEVKFSETVLLEKDQELVVALKLLKS